MRITCGVGNETTQTRKQSFSIWILCKNRKGPLWVAMIQREKEISSIHYQRKERSTISWYPLVWQLSTAPLSEALCCVSSLQAVIWDQDIRLGQSLRPSSQAKTHEHTTIMDSYFIIAKFRLQCTVLLDDSKHNTMQLPQWTDLFLLSGSSLPEFLVFSLSQVLTTEANISLPDADTSTPDALFCS